MTIIKYTFKTAEVTASHENDIRKWHTYLNLILTREAQFQHTERQSPYFPEMVDTVMREDNERWCSKAEPSPFSENTSNPGNNAVLHLR